MLLAPYLAVLAYLVFTARPDLVSPAEPPKFGGESIFDLVMHAILYLKGNLASIGNLFLLCPLAFLLIRGFAFLKRHLALLICIMVSIGIELGQRHVPGRVPDAYDVIANVAGAFGVLFAPTLIKSFLKRGTA
jgi:VanZ family protein